MGRTFGRVNDALRRFGYHVVEFCGTFWRVAKERGRKRSLFQQTSHSSNCYGASAGSAAGANLSLIRSLKP